MANNNNSLRGAMFAVAFIALFSVSVPVHADPPPGKGWRAHEEADDDSRERHEGSHDIKKHHRSHHRSINNQDLVVINGYLAERVRPGFCPPGLAKKHNGCLPPGQARKYRLGQPLPEQIVIQPLPQDILVRLHPPADYYYAQVDGDVLLVSEATKKIMDAVTLLSAVH